MITPNAARLMAGTSQNTAGTGECSEVPDPVLAGSEARDTP